MIQGYGLGLGILKGILELHHLGFGYVYEITESQPQEKEIAKIGKHYFKVMFPKGVKLWK